MQQFECDLCEQYFSQYGDFNKHNWVKPFKCDFCDKSFSQSGNLNIHKLTHTGIK